MLSGISRTGHISLPEYENCIEYTFFPFLLFFLTKKVNKKVKPNAIAPRALAANAPEHSVCLQFAYDIEE